ncbi:MAG: hypothetical protein WB493_14240 [Anaeromyxobacteraceae bacterium]
MRRHIVPFLAVAAVALFVGTSVARAKPFESFTLEIGDRIIAETPGCFANCTASGPRRTCTVKDFDCKAVCTTLQECKPDGIRPMKVCAVIRESK